jgi:hypothetical protein
MKMEEFFKLNHYPITVVYVLAGIVIFAFTSLYNWLFWSISSFSQPYIWQTLLFYTMPAYTITYIVGVLVIAFLSTKKRKSKIIHLGDLK